MSHHERDPGDVFRQFVERRREKIRTEIERNRRGDFTVPTWVLVLAVAALLAACAWIYVA